MCALPKRAAWLIAALAVALVLLVILTRTIPEAAPQSDFALIDLQVLDTLHGVHAIGPYSRFGWNHPGPMYFQLLAPLYALSGYRHLSVIVTATLMNLAAVAGMFAVLRRSTRGFGMLVASCGLFTVYLVRAWGLIASPWNAHVPILSLGFLVACCTGAASGRMWMLPLAVGVASFICQTHVGLAASSVGLVVCAVSFLVVDAWRAGQSPWSEPLVRPLIASLALATVLWALPIADQVAPSGRHNLGRILESLGSLQHMGWRDANRIFAHYVVAPLAPDLTLPWGRDLPPQREDAIQVLAEAQGALLVGSIVFWARRGRKFEARFGMLTLAAVLAAFYAVHRLPPYPNDHAVFWVSLLGVLSWTTILAVPIELMLDPAEAPRMVVGQIASRYLPLLTVLVLGGLGVRQATLRARDDLAGSPRIRALAALAVAEAERAGTRTPRFQIDQSGWAAAAGVVLQLELAGFSPRVAPGWTNMFGPQHDSTGTEPIAIRLVDAETSALDYRHRLDYRSAGTVEDVSMYVEEPPLRTVVADEPLTLVGTLGLVSRPENMVSRIERTPGDPELDSVTLFDPGASATVAVPRANLVGIRMSGGGGTPWGFECSQDGSAFLDAGRIRMQGGPGIQVREILLRGLADCRQLRIRSLADEGRGWLSEVQLLVRAAGS